MTEWWLRKAVIRHLFPIFCNYYFIRDGITMSPLTRSVGSVTLAVVLLPDTLSFQLTRSVGSVTPLKSNYIWRFHEFQLTRSVGSVTIQQAIINEYIYISTHTLRGERDIQRYDKRTARHTFQLTRSVGSVTFINNFSFITVTISTHTLREERDYELVVFGDLFRISTHTLRGERDYLYIRIQDNLQDFNSHAPWGA